MSSQRYTPEFKDEAVRQVLERQFGYRKMRYRGLVKNHGQVVMLFALANLWMAVPGVVHRRSPLSGSRVQLTGQE